VVAEIHPPAGAASAYREVQAAEINARTSISDERGRAERMNGVAQQEAREATDAASASATETLSAANQAAYGFAADQKSYAMGPDAFMLERRNKDLVAALSSVPLTLIDHRIDPGQLAVIDLRPASASNDAATQAAIAATATKTPTTDDAAASQPTAEAAAQVESTQTGVPDKD
jgi:hypothetical protein